MIYWDTYRIKLLEARYISEMLSFSMHTRPVVSTKQIKFQVTALSVLSTARLNVAMPLDVQEHHGMLQVLILQVTF